MDRSIPSQIDLREIPESGKTLARIDVPPGPRPIFVKPRDGKSQEIFYIRNFNTTEQLKMSLVMEYINTRWKK
jgi:hypothetical protein